MNPLNPNLMSSGERRAELVRLLALGLIRLRARQSSELSAQTEKVRSTFRPTEAVMRTPTDGETHDRHIPARLAALKTTPTPDLKQQWRELFDTEPPPYNRRFLESRLAYRIQELAYGGLKPETVGGSRRWASSSTADGRDRAASAGRRQADRRHAADPRVAGRRAHGHRHRRRLRLAGPALQVALGHRPRHHRHALERLGLLRAQEPDGGGA